MVGRGNNQESELDGNDDVDGCYKRFMNQMTLTTLTLMAIVVESDEIVALR